ncbi:MULTISPECIES: sulfatase [unclassified Algibacter]|uniref:sulfatase family protein n=1 Tax=unclassified Algibacter TaxID=2615009 RepID=UPI00131AACAF|nr:MULTISPECIES: sulfatase [unclassified Algibacter]MCL5129186.1 sulfatase [Algibacter sp. L4_22]
MEKSRSFYLGIFALCLFVFTSCKNKTEVKKEAKDTRPNILYIMADDNTSQALGIYGGILKDYVHTPNIQRLATEGAVLDNCLVSNSLCTPSRATVLTGQYSHINGVTTLGAGLPTGHKTIAGVLQRGGYQTSILGKWHMKQEPTDEFDYYCVLPGQGRYWDPILKTKENWKDYDEGGKVYEGYSTDVITGLTIDWMENRDKSKPFMAMCNFKATHEPFDYPERFSHLYKDVDIPVPSTFYDEGPDTTGRSFNGQSIDSLKTRYLVASKDPDNVPGYMQYPGLPFDVDGLDRMESRYKTYQKYVKDFMRCGAAIDDNIGKLLKYLEESGLAENTIVIYTADQGYFLGEHGFFDKRLIYEESIHMPFVIRYPKEIPAGTRNSDLIENVDFSALFADYAGLEYPKDMQGHSFRENLKGNTSSDWRKYGYYRYWDHTKDRPGHFGIKGKQYTLSFSYGHAYKVNGYTKENAPKKYWDFFDLEKDPLQIHNGYYDPEYQDIIKELKNEILNQRVALGDLDTDHPEVLAAIDAHWND